MSQVAADLRAAADVLERDGWTQGRFGSPDGRCCATGAIAAVVTGGHHRTPYGLSHVEVRQWVEAVRYMSACVANDGSVATWNDAPGRTADEVIAALRAAADRAEAEQ